MKHKISVHKGQKRTLMWFKILQFAEKSIHFEENTLLGLFKTECTK